jgi:amino acid transporter
MGIKHAIGPARLRAPRVYARARGKAPVRQRDATFISWTAVAMMTVGAVGYLGSAPALSVLGLASVFLYVLPAIVFLLPASLVSAELASGWQGGVYNWVREGISAPMGLLAVWCQFAQTIFYYPALLAYVAGTLAYVINPSLANNGVYTAVIIVVLFWGSVLVSSRGPGLVAKLASSGTLIGTLIPGALLVVLGVIYLLQGNHSAAPMDVHHVLPAWSGLASIVLIVNSFFTYAGVEVNAVHVDELRDPGREFPKAMFVAAVLVLAVFVFPTLAISWVIPTQTISLTAGVMQAFDALLKHLHLGFALPVVALALAIGALGGMIAWLDGPSEGLLKIGREQGYLPPYFQKVDDEGIALHILIAQGVVITVIGFLYAVIPTVNSAYWIFAAMATQVYLIMYGLMFIAAMRLRHTQPDHPRGYRAPALGLLCALGAASSVAAFLIGFVPPSQFGHASPLLYGLLILAGILALGVLPPLLLEWRRKPDWKASGSAGTAG